MAIALAKPKDISPARLAAFNVLKQVESGGFSSTLLAIAEPGLKPPDRALCHELVLGVLRWQLLLDEIAAHFSGRRSESLDPAVRIALRLGLYQLRFLNRIPAAAAVNESVSLVRLARLQSATGFVNAVLRRVTREPEYDPVKELTDPLAQIALETSHPRWLIERWSRSFGLDQAGALARANNEQPPTALRVVQTRADEAEVLAKLTAAGATLSASTIATAAWRVSGATALQRELMAAGEIYLQDEGSQLVAQVLAAVKGERVLDLCAAPGGKTTQIADRVRGEAVVIAADRSAARMATVVEATRRQGLEGIEPVLLDAAERLPFQPAMFDRVLVDAPCSGTGTLRRNPEIRWRLSANDILTLAQAQKKILKSALEMIKPGGCLVYSTCSVECEENEDVVQEVIGAGDRFRLLRTIRTWPQQDGCDGFFIAAFAKAKTL